MFNSSVYEVDTSEDTFISLDGNLYYFINSLYFIMKFYFSESNILMLL